MKTVKLSTIKTVGETNYGFTDSDLNNMTLAELEMFINNMIDTSMSYKDANGTKYNESDKVSGFSGTTSGGWNKAKIESEITQLENEINTLDNDYNKTNTNNFASLASWVSVELIQDYGNGDNSGANMSADQIALEWNEILRRIARNKENYPDEKTYDIYYGTVQTVYVKNIAQWVTATTNLAIKTFTVEELRTSIYPTEETRRTLDEDKSNDFTNWYHAGDIYNWLGLIVLESTAGQYGNRVYLQHNLDTVKGFINDYLNYWNVFNDIEGSVYRWCKKYNSYRSNNRQTKNTKTAAKENLVENTKLRFEAYVNKSKQIANSMVGNEQYGRKIKTIKTILNILHDNAVVKAQDIEKLLARKI